MERTMRMGVLLVALLGCAQEEVKDTEAPPVENNTDTEPIVCEGTAPVLTELTVGDYGELYDFEDGPAPALLVAATATDEDGDLHEMAITWWFDDVIDGAVDTSVAGNEQGYIRMEEQDCATAEATYGVIFEVDGNRFDYETEYEFAAEAYDAAGLVTGQLVASGVTPAAAGR